MTVIQKRKILFKIQQLELDIEEIRRVRLQIAKTGYASATISATGGSKSYTRTNLSELTDLLYNLTDQLQKYRILLTGNSGPLTKTYHVVYS